MPDSEYEIPNDPDVTSGDIVPNADLAGVNLSEANLQYADLTYGNLENTNLTDVNLDGADLTGANLRGANITGADLSSANLTDALLTKANLYSANLSGADLTGALLDKANLRSADLRGVGFTEAHLTRADLHSADLRGADFSDADLFGAAVTDADLRGANLTDANLGGTDLTGVILARDTRIGVPDRKIMNELSEFDYVSEKRPYEIIARTNHELRSAYSRNGLIGRARNARVRERSARRKEAFAEGGLRGIAAWFGSILSKVFTGYGVQLTWITGVMAVLYLVSAAVYHFVGEM